LNTSNTQRNTYGALEFYFIVFDYRNYVPSWTRSQAVSKPVWHIPLLCVQWKTPDDGQRNCPKHVESHSKNKFEKLMHLVGFIIGNLSWCTVTWTSNTCSSSSKTKFVPKFELVQETTKLSIPVLWLKYKMLAVTHDVSCEHECLLFPVQNFATAPLKRTCHVGPGRVRRAWHRLRMSDSKIIRIMFRSTERELTFWHRSFTFKF
jgi:hypothetical protein